MARAKDRVDIARRPRLSGLSAALKHPCDVDSPGQNRRGPSELCFSRGS